MEAEWLVAPFVAGTGIIFLGGRWTTAARPKSVIRAIDYAWRELAIQLLRDELTPSSASFLAALALSSLERGRTDVRAGALGGALESVEKAVAQHRASATELAALRRLAIADAVAEGVDPLPQLAQEIGRCFSGKLPLTYAKAILEDWDETRLSEGAQSRLRALLCDRAFEEGLEVANLVHAAPLVPRLNEIVDTEGEAELAYLRLLWSLRPDCPWTDWGKCATVFELALDSASEIEFARYPDLLLTAESTPEVRILSSGVVFQDTLFTEMPRRIESRALRFIESTEYQLVIDERRFVFDEDMTPHVRRLERLFRFYFHLLRGRANEALAWNPPAGTSPLSLETAVVCSTCQTRLLPVRNALAQLLENKQPADESMVQMSLDPAGESRP
jgi:hypothetical protein